MGPDDFQISYDHEAGTATVRHSHPDPESLVGSGISLEGVPYEVVKVMTPPTADGFFGSSGDPACILFCELMEPELEELEDDPLIEKFDQMITLLTEIDTTLKQIYMRRRP